RREPTRKRREPTPKDSSFKEIIMYGDLSTAPLDQLSAMVDELLIPLLQNPINNEAWPKFFFFFCYIYVFLSKTLLPVPMGADKVTEESLGNGHSVDTTLLHAIESVVIEWSHQIQNVPKKDSSQALLEDQNPLPKNETDFWKAKYVNLLNIHEQLSEPRVKKMAELLKKTNSSYYPANWFIFKPVSQHFDSIETTDFSETQPLYGPLFHTLCLMWANCKSYRRPARIIILLQEINNLIMKQASEFMEPIDLFKGEPDESMEKINQTCRALDAYQLAYNHYKGNVKNYFKNGELVKEWDFSPKLVFAKWDLFMQRVKVIQ
ncbi:unnamed protein product, partial [Didymodactylos carnosus]